MRADKTVPSVSIMMPVHNEERYLGQALASLFRQSCNDWELVAVDDHSTDGTARILADAAAADRRIRVLSSNGKGLVAALNTGLWACRAPLLARMDGDDVAHPRRLELQLARLTSNLQLDLLACSFRHIPRQVLTVGMAAYEQWQNQLLEHGEIIRDLYVESPFVHPSIMARRDILVAAGGYRDLGWPEDYDLWLRLAAGGARFGRTAEVLFFWRDRPERFTRTNSACTAEAFRECKAHHLARGFLAGAEQVTLAGAGQEGRAWQRTLGKLGIRVGRWLDVDPRKVGKILHGAPVVSGHGASLDGGKMLITVGTRGAREGIRRWAARTGFREGEDFICVT